MTGTAFGRFGSLLHMTRVSDFVFNRDSQFDVLNIIQAPDDIVLDMSLQDAGNDGSADAIDVELAGPGNSRVQISINGSIVWSDLRTRVLSLTVRGSSDRDVVRILDNLNIPVTVYGNSGADAISGSSGNEVFYGGENTDTLMGGGGQDELYAMLVRTRSMAVLATTC